MTSEPAPEGEVAQTVEDNKRRMREALEAKKGRHGEAHIDDDPRAPQAHGPVDAKRTFRRKTG